MPPLAVGPNRMPAGKGLEPLNQWPPAEGPFPNLPRNCETQAPAKVSPPGYPQSLVTRKCTKKPNSRRKIHPAPSAGKAHEIC